MHGTITARRPLMCTRVPRQALARILSKASSSSSTPSPGMFQNPIVAHLWSTRHTVSAPHSAYSSPSQPRPPSLSASSVTYPFSTDPVLSETYKSPWGEVRLGKVLEDLDAIAGNVAYSHAAKGGDWPTPLLVTAGVDSIQLCPDGRRADVARDMILTGAVQWVGSSSLSLVMSCRSEGSDGPWLTAKFTFVARDKETGKATQVRGLIRVGAAFGHKTPPSTQNKVLL